MQSLGRNAILSGSHVPRDREPDHEWGPGAVEDGSSRRRYPAPSWLAPEPPVGHPPMAGRPAPRANEAVGPSKPLKVVETCRVIRKPGTQVSIAARIIPPCSKTGCRRLAGCRHPHILCIQHSHGYPFSSLSRFRGVQQSRQHRGRDHGYLAIATPFEVRVPGDQAIRRRLGGGERDDRPILGVANGLIGQPGH